LLTKVEQGGSHPLTLSGNNSSFDGGVEITSGSVIFANDFAAGTGILTFRAPNPGLPSATFTTSAPKIYGLQSDTSDATVTLSANSTLTINQYSDTVYRGAIAGTNAALVKNDSGSLRLEGASTYNGGTTINGGQIVAGNAAALGTGSVTLNGGRLGLDAGLTLPNAISFGASGGVLAGNGTIGGAVALGQAAGLAPGFSVGTLNFGSTLTWGSGAYFLFEVQNPAAAAGAGYDTINVTGQLNLAATAAQPFTINVISLASDGSNGSVTVNPTATYKWQLANASSITGFTPTAINVDFTNFSAVDGSGLTVVPPFVGNFSLSTSLDNTKLFLSFTPVPEPSTWALMIVGAGAVLFPALRRRRK
jgi:autotransporter-associated beta strand protein